MISSVTVEVQHQKQRDISQDSADIEKNLKVLHTIEQVALLSTNTQQCFLLVQQFYFVSYLPFQSFKVYLSFFHPLFRVKIEQSHLD